jgi:histidinol-phosphatase (PHP family)
MFVDFYRLARELQEKTTSSSSEEEFRILVGMEIEWIHEEAFGELEAMRKEFDFDYLVGSVHHVLQIPIDYSPQLLEAAEAKAGGTEALFLAYFDAQYEMLQKVLGFVA